MPNKLSQFWQELKRRNVVRVVTVYAGAAFVIIELINNITEPLHLPEWTPTLVIVLLAIGFPVVIIFSWIYDVHPEGGMVKTEPGDKVKAEDIPKSSNGWRVASYISFVVIVALIVLNVIPRAKHTELIPDLETSIAVLPFENMSDDASYSHIGGAFTDEIIMELQKISGFDRVLSRTSTMQYEVNQPTIPEIAEKLNVNYIIEGSIQRLERRVRIRVQIIRAKNEDHIWGESYDEEYVEPEDILDIQSRIAQSVAYELKVRITPDELELIESVPTTNLTAFDFYQRGREEHWKYWNDQDQIGALKRAEKLYHEALIHDSTFAQAYTGLAWVYWNKHYWDEYYSEDFMDSVMILADKALYFVDQLAEAHIVRGWYFMESNRLEEAINELDMAVRINHNDWWPYYAKGRIYVFFDMVKLIENCQKAALLNRSAQLPFLLRQIADAFRNAGFFEKALKYDQEALSLDGDSVRYYQALASTEEAEGAYNSALDLTRKAYLLDSSDIDVLYNIAWDYAFLGQHQTAFEYYKRFRNRVEATGGSIKNLMNRIGYVYWQNGYREEAEDFFNQYIDHANRGIELGRWYPVQYQFYDIAGIYAFMGDREKAYEYLIKFNEREVEGSWMVSLIHYDPMFDSIRDEPEFQQIVRDVEAKYQAEHDRVRQWLEENDIL